jgi:hypothetical protein
MWTKEAPKCDGWYWMIVYGYPARVEQVYVPGSNGEPCRLYDSVYEKYVPVDQIKALWAGPIAPPVHNLKELWDQLASDFDKRAVA